MPFAPVFFQAQAPLSLKSFKKSPLRSLAQLSPKEKQDIIYRSSLNVEVLIRDVIIPLYEEIKESPVNGLKKYSQKWDQCVPDPLMLTREDLKESYENAKKKTPEKIEAFEIAYQNIKFFHEKQKPQNFEVDIEDNQLGYLFQPFDSVTLYIPGGTALYPSTALMGIIPAVIAGVQDITILTPPNPDNGRVPEIVQAIAYLAGAHRLLQAGGAQAILSAAIGISEFKLHPADFIYGPGNKYVAAAKAFVSSRNLCGVDTFAGPSEVVIIADETAKPNYLAHDLLAQAEHDEDALAILLCTDEQVADAAIKEIEKAIEERDSDRKQITKKAIQRNGHVFLVDQIEEAIDFSNEFAPEHLEIQTKNNEDVLAKIRAAGSIFLGDYSPVAVGDYYSGTNHILPTGRAARFSSGISVHSFFRRITYQKCSQKGLKKSEKPISIMSKTEGLFDEHGYSVLIRGEEANGVV